MAPRDEPATPRPERRDVWRCTAHEPLIRSVAAIEERTQRILSLLEQQARRDEELDRRQREDSGRGQRLSGSWSAGVRVAGLAIAFGAGLGTIIASVVAVMKLVGG